MSAKTGIHFSVFAAGVLLLLALAGVAEAQPRKDARIARLLAEVSEARLKASITALVGFENRNTLGFKRVDPQARTGIAASARWLHAALSGYGGRLKVFFQDYPARDPRDGSSFTARNVIAILPGTDETLKAELLVVGGHFDSRNSRGFDAQGAAPGANDDGSGTALVLELARTMAGRSFKRTLIFACFSGEEQGLWGSRFLATSLKGRTVRAMLGNDIVGSIEGGNGKTEPFVCRVFSGPSGSRELSRSIAFTAETYLKRLRVRQILRIDRRGRGGDHIPFEQGGFLAVRFTEANENYARQHQNLRQGFGDLLEHVSFPYLARVTRLNAATLAVLADGPSTPTGVRVRGAVRPASTVSWRLSEDAAIGYQVVWRRTTEARWTHARWAGRVSRLRLPGIAVDDYEFGVRAVDARGLPSLVAPARFSR